jgi:hypothetical protein
VNGPARIRLSCLLLAGVFLLTLPAVTTRIYASDEVEGFAWLHSLLVDRDVSFQNEYEYFYDSGQVKNPGFHQTFLEDRFTDTGRRPNFATMGSALLWTPFYAVGHLVAIATGAKTDGFSPPYVAAVAWGSAVYGFVAVLLSIAIARRVVGGGIAPGIAVWAGTPLLFYMYVTPIFTHACSAFAVALFLWIWIRVRDAAWTPRGAFLLGLAGGVMTIVRAQDALFVAGPAIDFVRFALSKRLRATGYRLAATGDRPSATGYRPPASGASQPAAGSLQPAAFFAAVLCGITGFILAMAPQLLAFKALNGRFRQSEFETRKMSWTSPHGWQVLFDHQHGLFFWTPLALLAVAGLVMLCARGDRSSTGYSQADRRWVGALALLMFALQAYIAGAVESWTVAGAFGQRRFISLTPLLVLGLAALLAPARRTAAKAVAAAVIALAVWWNVGLMAQFGLHTMDRERLTLRSNARQTFVDLPSAAPSLVWRYLTDRASFYNQPRR